jgi:hypothetical protein
MFIGKMNLLNFKKVGKDQHSKDHQRIENKNIIIIIKIHMMLSNMVQLFLIKV